MMENFVPLSVEEQQRITADMAAFSCHVPQS